jgi:hypothetical protein
MKRSFEVDPDVSAKVAIEFDCPNCKETYDTDLRAGDCWNEELECSCGYTFRCSYSVDIEAVITAFVPREIADKLPGPNQIDLFTGKLVSDES